MTDQRSQLDAAKRPAVFLDRDGTLIEEVNFLSRVEDMRLFPQTVSALTRLRSEGFLLVVVTNQSGIGRGLYSTQDMNDIHDALQSEVGGLIDAFYHCPHLPDAGCRCRKPSLGMIEQAIEDLAIDMSNSWMIGDKSLDIELGNHANLATVLVATGYGQSVNVANDVLPTHFVDNIGAAADVILVDQTRPKSSSKRSISSSPK